LALYTGNATYADWAEKTFDWVYGVGLMSEKFEIYDGAYFFCYGCGCGKGTWDSGLGELFSLYSTNVSHLNR